MILERFRVEMYKGVIDSGDIHLEDLTVLVGKNESGKTSVLQALYKLKPFEEHKYDINREWPRGRRSERDAAHCPCKATFRLEEPELTHLERMCGWPRQITHVTAARSYSGDLSLSIAHEGGIPRIVEPFVSARLHLAKKKVIDATGNPPESKAPNAEELKTANRELARQVEEAITKLIPTMIYMDDYRAFSGSCNLQQLRDRKNAGQLEGNDETVLMILKLSGLSLDEEVEKGNQSEREQRQYDLDDAAATLTNEIEGRWDQRKYEVQFRADGQLFYTFVKDEHDASLIRLEERSKGFQWFFSFDLMFMHESKGTFAGCVVLLDEPGLHLHPAAQEDLLRRLEAYARGNRLVYTTHLPFMIELRQPERVRILSESDAGPKVQEDLTGAQPEAKFVLQAALGMKGACSYSLARQNLLVEGVDDYWIISGLSNLLVGDGKPGLPDDVMITPCGGASEAAYIATIMLGQKLDVVVLLDSDSAGDNASDALVKRWLNRYRDGRAVVCRVGEVVGGDHASIEDLYSESAYLDLVKKAYEKELKAIGAESMELLPGKRLVDRVEKWFEKRGTKFNHGRVAIQARRQLLAARRFQDLDKDLQEKGKKLIDLLRSSFENG